MNHLNINQTGGFPMTTRILDELQKAYTIFNSLGSLAGDKTIISGCVTIGSAVSDGTVFYNGELFFFQGGGLQTKVKVVEVSEALVFENNESKTVIKTRYITFGTGVGAMDWVDFKRTIETKSLSNTVTNLVSKVIELEKKTAVFQDGGSMVLWKKPANLIPEGWQEVVEWRGRMPIGYDSTQPEFNEIGKADGIKQKKLSEAELPKISPINGSLIKKGGALGGTNGLTIGDVGTGDYEEGELIKPFGGGQAFSILNPYRVVMFIEYVG